MSKPPLAAMIFAALLIGPALMLGASAPSNPPSTAPVTQPAAPRLEKSLQLLDVDGRSRNPLQAAQADGAKGIVFIFIAVDCPISNSYAPAIKRLIARYSSSHAKDNAGNGSFDFYLVHSDPDLAAADAKKHATDYGYTCPVLMDPKEQISKQLGASVTPQACVVGTDGELLYSGRIDDWYVDFGKQRLAPTTFDLRDALDEVQAGITVKVSETKAIGCPI